MELIEATILSEEQKEAVLDIWNREYPQQVGYKTLADLEHYLEGLSQPYHLLLKNERGAIEGWACRFVREGEKWFVILLRGTAQGQGKGSLMLDGLKKGVDELYGWVVDHDRYVKQNGEPYRSPLPFYLKNDFTVCTESRLELDFLSAVRIKWVRKSG